MKFPGLRFISQYNQSVCRCLSSGIGSGKTAKDRDPNGTPQGERQTIRLDRFQADIATRKGNCLLFETVMPARLHCES